MPKPFMTDAEIDFLASHIRLDGVVFEWGSGGSTLWLAERCRSVLSVEHDHAWAARTIQGAAGNPKIELYYAPPAMSWRGPPDDGDLDNFASYVYAYRHGFDVVIIDGRARVACAERVAQIGGQALVFLHDCDRTEYAPAWDTHLRQLERVGNLMLLGLR